MHTGYRSIKTNFLLNLVLNGSTYLFPLIITPYVSRILLPDGMGKVSFATSLIAYFTMFAMLGVPTYGIRACARVRDDITKFSKTVQEIFLMNIVLCILTYIVFGISINIIPKMSEQKNLLFVMGTAIFLNVIGMDWVYKGLEEYVALATRSIVFKVVALILIFTLIHKKEDYVFYGMCTVIASYGANLWNFVGIKRYISLQKIQLCNIKKHFKMSLVFFAMSIATTVYTNLDVVMLGFMADSVQAGYYDATLKIKVILIGVVTSLGAVLLPRVSYYIEQGMYDRFWVVAKRALNCILLLAMPLVCYFVILSEPIIVLFSGDAFIGAVTPMKILVPTILMIGLTNIIGIQVLVPLGHELYVLYSEIAGAIVDLCINFWLIPKMGAIGAAIGTLIAEIIVLVVQIYLLRKRLIPILTQISLKKIAGASFLSSLTLFFTILLPLSNVAKIVVSSILFGIVYILLLHVFKEQEFLQLEKLIKNIIHK